MEKNQEIIERDILGLKPLWYSHHETLEVSNKRKKLEKNSAFAIFELNPLKKIIYNKKNNKIIFEKKQFFSIIPQIKKSKKIIQKELAGLIINSIAKRIPDEKFGILFSGGVDSTLIALICKQLGVDFTCYSVGFQDDKIRSPEDIEYAEKTAKSFGFKLKKIIISKNKAEKYIKKIIPIIESTNVVKIGVALPLFVAMEQAKKDKIKTIFSGLGSEEIFAGYERHLKSKNINKECIAGLKLIYERDLYRDYCISNHNKLKLQTPFLDEELVKYALKIPGKYKLNKNQNKIILREVAENFGLCSEFAQRKKRAAQYGSNSDKIIKKLSKSKGFKKKSEYLQSLNPKSKIKLAALASTGKDSLYSIYLMKKLGYNVNCIISVKSENPYSYMFHTANIHLTKIQSDLMNLPLYEIKTKGEEEKELEDLENGLKAVKNKFKITGIIVGAILSNYQKARVEKICKKLKLKLYAPLWHINQETYMRNLVFDGFKFILVNVASLGFNKSWLGKTIQENEIDELVKLNEKLKINISGEGGEYETLVLDCPMFSKEIKIKKSRIVMDSKESGFLKVEKIGLLDKN